MIQGIVPVMITPFDADGAIDWGGLETLIEWYIENGSQALFAVCQSSEMLFLSLEERRDLASFTVRQAAGRVPVLASGHISESPADQIREMQVIGDTGIDCLVFVSNRLDPDQTGGETFRRNLDALTGALAGDIPLGMYECPVPYRRLLSDDELTLLRDDPRFVFLKDVSCELDVVRRRLALAEKSNLAINNACGAIAHGVLQAGGHGFCGVFNNFHPDLYRWLQDHGLRHPELAEELAVFLALASVSEYMGYPKLAKLYHQRLGTFADTHSRVITGDITGQYWGLEAILDKIAVGAAGFRDRIAALTA